MLEKFQGERRKQYFILGVALLAGSAGILFLSEAGGKKTGVREREVPEVKVVDEKKVEEESFRGVYGRRLKEQEEEIKRLKAELERLKTELKRKEEKLKSVLSSPPPSPSPPPPPPPPPSSRSVERSSYVPPPPSVSAPSGGERREAVRKGPPQKELLKDLIVLDYTEKKGDTVRAGVKEGKAGERKAGKRSVGEVIPAGSFVRGILLSGLNAPAGGKALSNPLPVL
ncbi:MAG: hypothetical protein Q9N26_07730, partial [Aquificota bacterium]|nr:hypothetical protein [Aquificota bacterium]